MTTLLVMIPVPPEEAKQRLARAKQEAKAARKQAKGLVQFAPKDKRIATKVTNLLASADLNDRIAQGCRAALEDAFATATLDDEDTSVFEQPEPVLAAADVDEDGG